MARLILINGLPGSGKSTLARRYVQDHPLALCLDIDVIRGFLGGWLDHPTPAGLLARRMAVAMAREALSDDHDVVVPQFLARPEFIARLGALAADVAARFVEVALVQGVDQAVARLRQREAEPMDDTQRDAHRLLARSGGIESVADLHAALNALVAQRPATAIVEPIPGDFEGTYRGLLDLLADPDGTSAPRTAGAG